MEYIVALLGIWFVISVLVIRSRDNDIEYLEIRITEKDEDLNKCESELRSLFNKIKQWNYLENLNGSKVSTISELCRSITHHFEKMNRLLSEKTNIKPSVNYDINLLADIYNSLNEIKCEEYWKIGSQNELFEFYCRKISEKLDYLSSEKEEFEKILEAYDRGAGKVGITKLSKKATSILDKLSNSVTRSEEIDLLENGIKQVQANMGNEIKVSASVNGDMVVYSYLASSFLKQSLLSSMKHSLYLIDKEIKSVSN